MRRRAGSSWPTVTGVLRDAGAEILASGPDCADHPPRPASGGRRPVVRTAPYPGFPTDAQPVVMAALAMPRRSSRVRGDYV